MHDAATEGGVPVCIESQLTHKGPEAGVSVFLLGKCVSASPCGHV